MSHCMVVKFETVQYTLAAMQLHRLTWYLCGLYGLHVLAADPGAGDSLL